MATIKIQLITAKKLSDGRHPINIVVWHNDALAKRSVGSALKEEWDDEKKKIKPKGRKDHVLANIEIEDEFDKYKAKFNELVRSGTEWQAADVFKEAPKLGVEPKTFVDLARSYLDTIRHKYSYPGARSRLEKIIRYSGDEFMISDIDNKWISGFILHCQTKEKSNSGGIGNSKNTINLAFKFIKSVASFADIYNPYLRKYKISNERNLRAKLTSQEIESIKNLELDKGTLIWHAKNIFLLQYYFRGMRIGDALRLEESDFKNGRLNYDARKTGIEYDIKVVDAASKILANYIPSNRHYLFPFLRVIEGEVSREEFQNEIKNRTVKVNMHLKTIAKKCGIDKRVTTHIARHSFASIADKQLGGDLKTLQGLFGHSSRKITEIYIRDLRKTDDLDDAADKILG